MPLRINGIALPVKVGGGSRSSPRHDDTSARPDTDRIIFVRGDRAVPYGELMDVLEILRAGDYTKIKLVALEGAAPMSDFATP